MDIDALKAEISLLLTQMENQPQNSRELHEQMREKINEMRAFGMPIPEDFLQFEKKLEEDLLSDTKEERGREEG